MYFEDNQWVGHLEDPPSKQSQVSPLSPGLLTASYYLPIVQAMVELDDDSLDRGRSAVYGTLREAGITFVLPTFIFDPLSSLPIRQDADTDALSDAGDTITASWRSAVGPHQLPGGSSEVLYLPQPSVDALNRGEPELEESDEVKAWTGLDLVTVVINENWSGTRPA